MHQKALGKRINQMRKSQKITSEKLSELCGVNAVHIRNIEGGRKLPSITLFVKICNALHISPNYLLQEDLSMNEVDELQGIAEKCKNLSQKQLEKVGKLIDAAFDQEK